MHPIYIKILEDILETITGENPGIYNNFGYRGDGGGMHNDEPLFLCTINILPRST